MENAADLPVSLYQGWPSIGNPGRAGYSYFPLSKPLGKNVGAYDKFYIKLGLEALR